MTRTTHDRKQKTAGKVGHPNLHVNPLKNFEYDNSPIPHIIPPPHTSHLHHTTYDLQYLRGCRWRAVPERGEAEGSFAATTRLVTYGEAAAYGGWVGWGG